MTHHPDSPDWTHRVVHANNQRIHFVEEGEGPIVLLVHGWPENWVCWRNQLVPIAEAGYRAIAPDMRGYGRSSKPARVDAYRVTELVSDLTHLVRALGEEQGIIVGHDWGAGVAWTAAWTRPDVFRAVAGLSCPFGGRGIIPLMTDPLGSIRPSELHRFIVGRDDALFYRDYWMTEDFAKEIETDLGDYLRRFLYGFSADGLSEDAVPDYRTTSVEEVLDFTRTTGACIEKGKQSLDRLPPVPAQLPDWLADDVDYLTRTAEQTGLRGGRCYYGALDVSWEALAAFEGAPVTVPALFLGADRDVATLWGAESIALFPESVPQLHQSLILEDCGHWMPREKPRETTEALLSFFRALDG